MLNACLMPWLFLFLLLCPLTPAHVMASLRPITSHHNKPLALSQPLVASIFSTLGFEVFVYLSLLPSLQNTPHQSKCLVNNAVPLPPPRAALPLALPRPLPARPPLLNTNSRRLTRPPLLPNKLLPCRLLPSRALAPVSSPTWLPPLREYPTLSPSQP